MALREVLLLTIFAAVCFGYENSYTKCPNQEIAKHLIGNTTLVVEGKLLTVQIRTVRLPATGLYAHDINCLLVEDTTGDQSSGQVELIEGGINQRYAKFKFSSRIGGSLRYSVQAYSIRP